jgi:hypothetical protein
MTQDSAQLPDPDEYEWEFERRGSVGVWFMEGWQGFADDDLAAASEHYRERGARSDIDATLAVFGGEANLGRETQEYMGDVWSENGEYTGVDRIGFVADGTTAMAVKSQVDVPGAEIESFSDLDAALAWASE